MALKHRGHHSHRAKEDPPKAAPASPQPAGAAPGAAPPAGAAPANQKKANNKKLEATNVVGSLQTKDIIVEASPFEIKRCDQVVMFNAKTLADQEDYLSRKDAFFTISAYLVNMFESKDSNKLLESISLSHITNVVGPLRGTKYCLLFVDSVSERNLVMCLKDENEMVEIHKAYEHLNKCRVGGEIEEFDPTIINKILNFSCNGVEATDGVEFDMPEIRNQIAEELKSKGVNFFYFKLFIL
jgi:hypothetical protein